MSPSSPTTPSPGPFTQLPTSYKTDLLDLNVSSEEIERLIEKYNRKPIPILEDEVFCKEVCKFVAASGRVDEPKLDGWVGKESSRIDGDCYSAKMEITFAGQSFFHTDEQRQKMNAGLRELTFEGYGHLVACVLFLVEQMTRPKNSSKHWKQARGGYEPKNDQIQRPSRPAPREAAPTSLQRSKRDSRQPLRRSARIKKQSAKNLRYLEFGKDRLMPAERMLDNSPPTTKAMLRRFASVYRGVI